MADASAPSRTDSSRDSRHGRSSPRIRLLIPALVLVLAGAWLVQRLRGPELPAYRLALQPLVQNVVATGRVISTSRAQVGSEITGTVRERRVSEGDTVNAGDVLAVLRAGDVEAALREAEAALLQLQRSTRPQADAAAREAAARLEQAQRERRRREELFQRGLIAREALEQAQEAESVTRAAAERARVAAEAAGPGRSQEAQARERVALARAQLEKTVIRSGTAGTVLTRNVEPGDLVQPGRVLFEIARVGDTEIEVPVDEKNLAELQNGQPAQCVADAFPAQPFPATVNYIAPGIDAGRGTVTIRLRVDPVPGFLRQDMTVTVNVETGRRDSALVVPNDALVELGGATSVIGVRDGRAVRVAVQKGLAGQALTEITSGLAAGDWVLAGVGGATVQEGARVRVSGEALPATGSPATRRELPVQLD